MPTQDSLRGFATERTSRVHFIPVFSRNKIYDVLDLKFSSDSEDVVRHDFNDITTSRFYAFARARFMRWSEIQQESLLLETGFGKLHELCEILRSLLFVTLFLK